MDVFVEAVSDPTVPLDASFRRSLVLTLQVPRNSVFLRGNSFHADPVMNAFGYPLRFRRFLNFTIVLHTGRVPLGFIIKERLVVGVAHAIICSIPVAYALEMCKIFSGMKEMLLLEGSILPKCFLFSLR